MFSQYRDDILEESKATVSCESKGGEFSLMTHQKIVRDYINLYTPYRGLLIYHGLGAGKTCASIGIAEGLKENKQVIIMTPASLRRNYINELKTCGDKLYRMNQFWEFITTNDPSQITALSIALSLEEKYIKRKGGAWLVDVRKPPNYSELTSEQRLSLNDQIDQMIRAKYSFISYNGLRKSHLVDLSDDGKINPFSHKVVVIDEVHNFLRRIANKIGKEDSLSIKLYEYLMNAEDCRLVFLTGTPMINYPNEIGILFNMLRGYIKTFIFTVNVNTSERINDERIKEILRPLRLTDYVDYNVSSKQIVITRNPFEYASQYETQQYVGVKKGQSGKECKTNYNCDGGFICKDNKCVPINDNAFVGIIKDVLKKSGIEIIRVNAQRYKALPDQLEQFKNMFIDQKSAVGDMKNDMLFKMRIMGLTSYFRSAREELMPSLDEDKDIIIEEIDMSNYQFGVYELARQSERSQDVKNARKRKRQADGGIYVETTSTYRIFSRAFCNYVFPAEIKRPMPREDEDIQTALEKQGADEDFLDASSVEEKINNPDGKYELDDVVELQRIAATVEDSSYPARIQRALDALQANGDAYLSLDGLAIYSPNFQHFIEILLMMSILVVILFILSSEH